MKHLLAAVALLAAADFALRQSQGMRAVLAAMSAVGRAVGGWIFYGA